MAGATLLEEKQPMAGKHSGPRYYQLCVNLYQCASQVAYSIFKKDLFKKIFIGK